MSGSTARKITWAVDAKGCWNCTSHRPNGSGYPRYRQRRLSHFVYERHRGEIPDGLCVLHRCDNPRCINPEHLFLGTRTDNAIDKVRKQRQRRGQNHPHAKLTEREVIAIRSKRATGEKVITLAKEYGVCSSAISQIAKGRRWINSFARPLGPVLRDPRELLR